MKFFNKKMRKILSLIVVFVITFTSIEMISFEDAFAMFKTHSHFEGDGFNVKYEIKNKKKGVANGRITIVNTSDAIIENWHLAFYSDNEITNVKNATIESEENGLYIIKNSTINKNIPVKGKVSFDFKTSYSNNKVYMPKSYSLPIQRVVLDDGDYDVSLEQKNKEKQFKDSGKKCKNNYNYKKIKNNHFNIIIKNNTDEDFVGWRLENTDGLCFSWLWNPTLEFYKNYHNHNKKLYNTVIKANDSICIDINKEFYDEMEKLIDELQLSVVKLQDIYAIDSDCDGVSDGEELIAGSDPYFIESEEKITVSMCGYEYDEEENKYYVFDKFNEISGTVKDIEYLKSLNYTIYNSNDIELCKGKINKTTEWTTELKGLVMGENKIVFTAIYKNNKKYDVQINIQNLCEENLGSIKIDMNDNDGDGVINYLEDLYGSDKNNSDTDNDGVSDYVEIADIGSSPFISDSDSDGVADGDEDTDEDGLTDAEEILYGCDVLSEDTDNDGISDADEISNGTNPTSTDSDEDGMYDMDEITLNLSPISNDTDGDGVLDTDEINGYSYDLSNYSNLISAYDNLSIDVFSKGDNSLTFEFGIDSNSPFVNYRTPGYISDMFVFETDEQIEYAELSCDINEEELPDDAKPTIYYFDEESNELVEVEEQSCVNGKLIAKLEHFSKYVMLDSTAVYKALEEAGFVRDNIRELYDVNDATDSNNDGISDIVTRMICEGGLLTSTGINVFEGFSYEDIQENSDFDGDGLLNGEEIYVGDYTFRGMLAGVISLPTSVDSDRDGYSDYKEVKEQGTNPLEYELALQQYQYNAVDDYIERDKFMSVAYSDSFDDSTSKQVATWIGNNIYGSNYDMVTVYEKQLVDYFKYLSTFNLSSDDETLFDEFVEFADYLGKTNTAASLAITKANDILKGKTDVSIDKLNNAERILKDYEDKLKSLLKEKNQIELDYLNDAIPESVFDIFCDKNLDAIDQITNEYENFWANDIETIVYKDDMINVKKAYVSKVEKITKGIGYALTFTEIITNGIECHKEYNSIIKNADLINEYSYILDSIINNSDDSNLKKAARSILDKLNGEIEDVISEFLVDTGITVGTEFVNLIKDKINPYLIIIDLSIAISDMVFEYSDISLYMKQMWALTQCGDYLTDDYYKNIDFYKHTTTTNSEIYVLSDDEVKSFIDYFNAIVTLRTVAENKCLEFLDAGINFNDLDDVEGIAKANVNYLTKITGLYKLKAPYEISASKGEVNVDKLIESILGKGTVNIYIKDASTNNNLVGVDIYVDNKLYTTTTKENTSISVSAGIYHSIKAVKEGYIDVIYNEILVEEDESLSLETFMQVPYDENNTSGGIQISVINAVSGRSISDINCVIREGMNTTTGDVIANMISDAQGEISISDLPAGNYTCLIEEDGYIKTIFNFVCIGGMTRDYQVNVSPTLSNDEIRIVLSWGANPRDLDSHITGAGAHIYYYNKKGEGIELDVDDISGFGPETITLDMLTVNPGIYRYYVHLFAGTGTIATSGATVRVYSGDSLIKTYYADQGNISGSIWNVFTIDVTSGTISDL